MQIRSDDLSQIVVSRDFTVEEIDDRFHEMSVAKWNAESLRYDQPWSIQQREYPAVKEGQVCGAQEDQPIGDGIKSFRGRHPPPL